MAQTKFTLTIFFLFLTILVFGQTDTARQTYNKWTIGTILMSEQNRYFEKKFTPNFFNGIIFKRHTNYFSLRLGIEYINIIDKKDKYECCDQIFSEGYTNTGTIRLGIEKGFTFKNFFRPYFALDIIGEKSYSDKILTGGIAGIYENDITSSIGYGAAPTIGFEFLMTKQLSIALETRLRLIYTKNTIDIDNLDPYDNAGFYRIEDKQFQTTRNRLSALMLNYNF